MTAVAPLEIRIFSKLVNKAKVVEECAKKVASSRDTRRGNKNQGNGKYFQLRAQNFKRGGHVPQGQGDFRRNNYDQYQHVIGRGGCFTCGLPGHMAKNCPRKRTLNVGQNQQGRVFAVNAQDAAKSDPLMRDNCLFGEKTLVVIYDTGASHSFIALDKIEELGLKVSELAFNLHVHTPYQMVMTKLGCRQVSFKLVDREFIHDLIYLPMVGLELILGFDWLSNNWVLLDFFERSIWFMQEGEGGVVIVEGYYLNSVLVNYSGEECQGYILLAANKLGDEQRLDQISVVKDFSEVFPEDIPEFLPQSEIEFAIDLVRRAGPVSIAPYRMAPIELAELKT
ncbi:uncharacterized protein LOC107606958 [Arachis ipaensis]|uniref:uncharacterized protein LOC107606958 n=1 Tax=Arachis ipaensis TaxID=130454 RepID=UPI0007AEEA71|nr:uncharacterized protein LOC107606958 [Arachis ipaensis]XP_025628235.1 uncharacterized protein LOC112721379 [Arachis hypogaea]